MQLIYSTAPAVTLATNTFVGVPVVLQFDDVPLLSIVREQGLGYTTEIPIFHPDGTYLAKVKGTRVYPTEAGKTAGIELKSLPQMTVCTLAGKTLFEIQHQPGEAFRASAELYTPTGYFIKATDHPALALAKADGQAISVSGISMSNCTFHGVRIGIWLQSNGSVSLGVG